MPTGKSEFLLDLLCVREFIYQNHFERLYEERTQVCGIVSYGTVEILIHV